MRQARARVIVIVHEAGPLVIIGSPRILRLDARADLALMTASGEKPAAKIVASHLKTLSPPAITFILILRDPRPVFFSCSFSLLRDCSLPGPTRNER